MPTTTEKIVYEVRNPGGGELYLQEVGMNVARKFLHLIGLPAVSGWKEQILSTFDEQDGEEFLTIDVRFQLPSKIEFIFGIFVYEGADRVQIRLNGSNETFKEISLVTGTNLVNRILIALLNAELVAKDWVASQSDQGVFGKEHEINLGDLQRRFNVALKSVQ